MEIRISIVLVIMLNSHIFSQESFAEDNSIANDIVSNHRYAVVKIFATNKNNEKSTGTGFIINNDGGLITNFHVIQNAVSLEILFLNKKGIINKKNNTVYNNDIKIQAVDIKKDIALLKIKNYSLKKIIAPLVLTNKRVEVGDIFTIVSNPGGEARSTVSDDTKLGAKRFIDDFIKGRESFNSSYKYSVYQFNNIVKSGSSGAPLIDNESGEVIAVVAGATGDDEFAGFAIPVSHAIKLVNKNRENDGFIVADYFNKFELNTNNDPYYWRLKYNFGISGNNKIKIIGVVVNSISDLLEGVSISISDKHNNAFTFSASTDDTGRYVLEIPESKFSDWILQLSHPQYNKSTIEMGSISTTINDTHTLTISDDLRESAVWFYADPLIVTVGSANNTFNLIGEEMNGNTITRKVLDWQLCTEIQNCERRTSLHGWLTVLPLSGTTASEELDEVLGAKHSDTISLSLNEKAIKNNRKPSITSLLFKTNISNNNQYALMIATPNKDESFVLPYGFLYGIDGGVPNKGIVRITAFDEKGSQISKTSTVKSDGYFRIKISNKYIGSTATIVINSNRYKIPKKENARINISENNKLYISVVPK